MNEIPESGWLNGLPSDWIGGKYAVRELCLCLEQRFKTEQLAPWGGKPDPEEYRRLWGGTDQEAAHTINLNEHAIAVFSRAFWVGSLSPSLFDGQDFKPLPVSAFVKLSVVRDALLTGLLDIDPLWPDEWWAWNSQPWVVPKASFDAWLASPHSYETDGLPLKAEQAPDCDIARIERRRPSERARVPLSEAVSWVAFEMAFERLRLERALQWDGLANGNLLNAQRRIENALNKVMVAGADGKVAFFGRHVDSHGEKGVTQAPIEALTLDDYRGFVIGRDDLYYGAGLHRTYTDKNSSQWLNSVRRDHFAEVTISRTDLLKLFPPSDDTSRAFVVPLPATLPDIGPVMALDEALSWLAHGKPSQDIEIWQNAAGDLMFRDPSGAVIEPSSDGGLPPFMESYRQASNRIHGALRDGSLASYVAPTSGIPLLVPRFYWNGVNPESLHHVYRGMTPDDHGAGCPVLLSRLAFDKWRGAIAIPHAARADRAPSVKTGRPPSDEEILAKADEMKADGLDGRTIAQKMRLQPGFENVATTAVRNLIRGRWKQAGRPKKTA